MKDKRGSSLRTIGRYHGGIAVGHAKPMYMYLISCTEFPASGCEHTFIYLGPAAGCDYVPVQVLLDSIAVGLAMHFCVYSTMY